MKAESSFSFSGIAMLLIVLNTVMLGSITILYNPIKRAMNEILDEEKTELKAQLCYDILQRQKEYAEYGKGAYISGCMTTMRENLMKKAKDEEQRKVVDQLFDKREGDVFKDMYDFCSFWGKEYEDQAKFSNTTMRDLYVNSKCDEFGKDKNLKDSIDKVYDIVFKMQKRKLDEERSL